MPHSSRTTPRRAIAAAGVAVACAICPTAEATDPPTPITELVLYGIDADSHELMRYVFDTDTFTPIGLVIDQNGFTIDHPECLTYLPSGPHKGFYSVPSGKDDTGGPKNVLCKIDGLTADAYMYPTAQFTYKSIRGMTTVWDADLGDWIMYGIAHNNNDPKLVTFNPATGAQTLISTLDTLGSAYEGLATHPTDPDKLYIMTGWKLAELDIATGAVNEMADHAAWSRTEALELMVGDNGLAVTIPGVDPNWTQQGALFGFSDSKNMMLIYDPGGSNFAEYTCSFVARDCEGLVFLTQTQDPYGEVTVDACD